MKELEHIKSLEAELSRKVEKTKLLVEKSVGDEKGKGTLLIKKMRMRATDESEKELKRAKESAEKEAERILEESKKTILTIQKTSRKNFDRAVDIILKELG